MLTTPLELPSVAQVLKGKALSARILTGKGVHVCYGLLRCHKDSSFG